MYIWQSGYFIYQWRMQEFSKGGVLAQGKGGVQNICPDSNALICQNKGGCAPPEPPSGSATVYNNIRKALFNMVLNQPWIWSTFVSLIIAL